MRVLRSNKDSVMAMLEAFVHDPLINWRLLNTPEAAPEAAPPHELQDLAREDMLLGGHLPPCYLTGWLAFGGAGLPAMADCISEIYVQGFGAQ